MLHPFYRFCSNNGIALTTGQYAHLKKLVDRAGSAQENEHNNTECAGSSLMFCDEVEEYAKHLGFDSVRWDGLYPTFVKNGLDGMIE